MSGAPPSRSQFFSATGHRQYQKQTVQDRKQSNRITPRPQTRRSRATPPVPLVSQQQNVAVEIQIAALSFLLK